MTNIIHVGKMVAYIVVRNHNRYWYISIMFTVCVCVCLSGREGKAGRIHTCGECKQHNF